VISGEWHTVRVPGTASSTGLVSVAMEAQAAERPPATVGSRRAALSRAGLVAVPGALAPSEVERLAAALDRVYRGERSAGRIRAGEAMHLLGGIDRDDAFLELVDHPRVFPLIWGELGWNIHLYHSHLDVTPPRAAPRRRAVWGWHQDGGRQNLEVDGEPRPRLSLKVAYWLSDLSEPGRGNLLVIPGSQNRNSLRRPGPGAPLEQPAGAVPVLAAPGDALIFDRRLWHSRSDNLSALTRKAIFVAFTFRWVRRRDELRIERDGRLARLSPIRRQLLGAGSSARSFWGLGEEPVPLRIELARRGLLDPSVSSHR
jgi:ectoine hydroxylase